MDNISPRVHAYLDNLVPDRHPELQLWESTRRLKSWRTTRHGLPHSSRCATG